MTDLAGKENVLFSKQIAIFKENNGVLHTSAAMRLGIHAPVLYAMRSSGIIEAVSRGVFRLTELPPLKNPDLVTAALRVPSGVLCLLSALDFHGLSSQIPHMLHMAIPRSSSPSRIDTPPIKFYRFNEKPYSAGIETHPLDQVPIKVYSVEKTLADGFKYRNKLGMDVVIESLKLYREKKPQNINEILRYSVICRVEKIIKPYLESIL